MPKQPEIIIIGGGITGASLAFFLVSNGHFKGTVTVIENNPVDGSELAGNAWAEIRQQYSLRENIRMSQFTQGFVRDITRHLSLDGSPIDVGYVENRSLLLFEERQLSLLYGCNTVQRGEAVEVALLDPDDLYRGFPWLNNSGLAGGSLGLSGEGWIDRTRFLTAIRKKAKALGVAFLNLAATGLERQNNRITGVYLSEGRYITCDQVINAAGLSASAIAEWAGIDLKIKRRKRTAFSFACGEKIEGFPQVFDPSGVYVRPNSTGYLSSCLSMPGTEPESNDRDVDYDLFEQHIWPILAHRIPAFRSVHIEGAEVTFHVSSPLDQQPVIGPHPDIRNFHFATGFSEREIQHGPAAAHALSEVILTGEFQTIDLSCFSYERMVTGTALSEHTVF